MTNQTTESKKERVAKKYAVAHTQYSLYCDYEAMQDIEKLLAQWEILTDGRSKIEDYIKANLFDFYQKSLQREVEVCRNEGQTVEDVINKGHQPVLFPHVPKEKKKSA